MKKEWDLHFLKTSKWSQIVQKTKKLILEIDEYTENINLSKKMVLFDKL